MDCSLPRSSVHGIVQARVLEWVAIAFRTSAKTPYQNQQSAGSEESASYCSGEGPTGQKTLILQVNAPCPISLSSGSRQLRLVDGGGPCAGRVEILNQGSWGTICDYNWSINNARVVCRQLGCGKALQATFSSSFGAGSGPIWLDNVKCTGKESHVWRCPSWGWGKHYCDHSLDAGVVCSGMVSSCPPAGRMESSKKAGV